MATILAGRATAAQLIGFVVALRAKGETAEELSGLLDAVLGGGRARPAQRGPASQRRRHRRHRRRPLALDQRVDDGGDRRRRRRSAGVQARRPGASSKGGTADVLEALGVAIELSPEGVLQCVAGGRASGSASPLLPSGVPLRRAGPPRDRHPDRVQSARADGQPGPRPAPADRRRRRPLRRAHVRVAAGARLHGRVGGARRWARRADHDGPSTVLALDHEGGARTFTVDPVTLGLPRRPTSSWSAATRRTTPTSCGGCSAASAAPPRHRRAQRRGSVGGRRHLSTRSSGRRRRPRRHRRRRRGRRRSTAFVATSQAAAVAT